MVEYNRYPAMDADNNFPPAVRKALANSDEYVDVVRAYVNPLVADAMATDETIALAASNAIDESITNRNLIPANSNKVPQPREEDDVAFAVLFEDGSRTALELDPRGRPTDHAISLFLEKLPTEKTGVETELRPEDDIAFAVTFNDRERTALEIDSRGRPTDYAAKLIGEKMTPENLPSRTLDAIRNSVPTSAPIAYSSAPQGGGREYPTARKVRDTPILSQKDQVAETLYWPNFVDLSQSGGEGIGMLYSTDHAEDHAKSGIFLATADSPMDTFTGKGLMFRDDSGIQCETPSAWWDENTKQYRVLYQLMGVQGQTGGQTTLMATTPDLVNDWKRIGITGNMRATVEGGDGHTGYWRYLRYAGGHYAYSLYGGTSQSRFALWQSKDGVKWQPHPKRLGKNTPLIDHMVGYNSSWLMKWYMGDIIEWNGRPWWIGLVGPGSAGGQIISHRMAAMPMADDLIKPIGRAIDITPPAQSWEGGGLDYMGNVISHDGRLYISYRAGGKKGGIGVMEIV